MEEDDWYDWLAKNEEIRGGRVRVPGIVPDQTHQPPSHRPGDGETGQGRAGAGAAMSTSRPGWMGRGPTAAEGASSLAGGAGGAGLGYPEVARRMQEGAEVGFDATSSGSRGTAGRPGRKRTEGRGGGSLSDGEYGTKLRGERGSNSSSTRGGRGGHVAYMVHRELRDVELRLSTQLQEEVDALRAELFCGSLHEILANADSLMDGFNGVRAAQKDLRDALEEVEDGLAMELARSTIDRVDC